jgi:uncharacterized coiled-coil protein SlyX
MADDGVLARIDAHMERGNEHMERGNVLMAEVREEVRLTREAMVDNRTFAPQMITRLDRAIRDNAQAMDRMRESMGRMGERMERGTQELERIGAEQREENRAGRDALFAMIDRMNRLDPPAAGD